MKIFKKQLPGLLLVVIALFSLGCAQPEQATETGSATVGGRGWIGPRWAVCCATVVSRRPYGHGLV